AESTTATSARLAATCQASSSRFRCKITVIKPIDFSKVQTSNAEEMARSIASGVDVFDCVIPTRLARHGSALVKGDRWNLKNARFKTDFTPIDADCNCYTCQNFTRAYVSHLLRSQELLAYTLISIHNITELVRFTRQIRESILRDRFTEEFAHWLQPDPASHSTEATSLSLER
ncbi:MAG: tRNA-guanine transglycosylase, partial [Leptolyngbyaceae cyanobacterium SM1_3_5]|nr:tRNA-guanine transglycosylase [Leptolyngbyaceae cyanobacterium SM1_3_5]